MPLRIQQSGLKTGGGTSKQDAVHLDPKNKLGCFAERRIRLVVDRQFHEVAIVNLVNMKSQHLTKNLDRFKLSSFQS